MTTQKNRDWAAALKRAVNRESKGKGSPKWLDVIAERVCAAAAEGDPQAFKEIGDRIDGKPVSSKEISGPDGGEIPVGLTIGFRRARN